MLPETNLINGEIKEKQYQTKDFKLDKVNKIIAGYVQDKEDIAQRVYVIMNTERYDWIIHTWNHGIETKDLYGEPVTYVCSELERRCKERLLAEINEIEDVYDFEFETQIKRKIQMTFKVKTKYGEFSYEQEVNY